MLDSFATLGLGNELLITIKQLGYRSPTDIQTRAIPIVLSGKDLLAIAQTGTGKTAAYALPLLERLKCYANNSTSPAKHPVRLLILAPTRELAEQIGNNFSTFLTRISLKHIVIYGGTLIAPQVEQLQQGVEIVVATVGRLLDIIKQEAIQLNKVEMVVLDEADKMLDIGFFDDIDKIFAQLPYQRQTLLFSATFSQSIEKLVCSLLRSPERIEITPSHSTNILVEQHMIAVEATNKNRLLTTLLRQLNTQILVFCNTKVEVNRIANFLKNNSFNVAAIHGDQPQLTRIKALHQFKTGSIPILVSTDILARGLDINALPCVINFDLPQQTEDYVHRIGRTGRAGLNGLAISFVDDSALDRYQAIAEQIQQPIALTVIFPYQPQWIVDKNILREDALVEKLNLKKVSLAPKIKKRCAYHKRNEKESCALLLPDYGIKS